MFLYPHHLVKSCQSIKKLCFGSEHFNHESTFYKTRINGPYCTGLRDLVLSIQRPKSFSDNGFKCFPDFCQANSQLIAELEIQFIPIQFYTSWGLNNLFRYNSTTILSYCNTIPFELANPAK